MEEEFAQLKSQLETIRLSAAERERVHAVLSEYVTHRPVSRGSAPAPVGYAWFAVHRFVAVVAVALVVVLFGGTVSYAAEGALPGDALYAVKVGVNEPLRDTFARTPEHRATREVDKVNRRLAEAETLAAEGRLNAALREDIETRVTVHLAAAEARVAMLKTDTDIAETLDATLDVHDSILASLGEDEVDGEEVGVLLARVRTVTSLRAHEYGRSGGEEPQAPMMALQTPSPSADEEEQQAAAESGAEADLAAEITEVGAELDTLQERALLGRPNVRISVREEAERLLNAADRALADADKELAKGEFETAEEKLTLARRALHRATIVLNAALRLPENIKLFPVRLPENGSDADAQNGDGDVESASVGSDREGNDDGEDREESRRGSSREDDDGRTRRGAG